MSQYVPNVFYDTDHLTLAQKLEMLRDAHADAFEWWVDELDVSKSSARRKVEMSFEDILAKLDQKCHFVFIHRKGYEERKDDDWGRWYLEAGFCTMTGVSYYLWTKVDEKLLEKYTTKYELEPK